MQKYGTRLLQQTIEIRIGDTSGSYALPDDTILRDCRVVGLYATENPSDDRKAPSGRPLIGPGAMRNAYISLKCDNIIQWNNVPLQSITMTGSDRTLGAIDTKGLTPNQSTIVIADTSTITAGESILLHFFYIK